MIFQFDVQIQFIFSLIHNVNTPDTSTAGMWLDSPCDFFHMSDSYIYLVMLFYYLIIKHVNSLPCNNLDNIKYLHYLYVIHAVNEFKLN